MKVQIAPGVWQDMGPQTARPPHRPTGYQLSESPLSTLASVEAKEQAATAHVGKYKAYDGKVMRKVRIVR